MKPKSDSVFLLTLVDLLVQVIFLGVFIGAVFIANENNEKKEIKTISQPAARVIVEVGIIKVAELVDSMAKLVPIDRIMELSVILPEFKSIENLKAALKLSQAFNFIPEKIIEISAILPEFKSIENLKAALRLVQAANFVPEDINKVTEELKAKSAAGIGLPVCTFGSDNNKNLMRVQGLDNSYLLSIITPKAQEILNKFQLNYKEGDQLTNDQVEALGKLIANSEKGCRYSVIYEPVIDSLRAYRRISKYFYTTIPSGWGAPK